MHGLVDFQPGRPGDFINGDAGEDKPGSLATQEPQDHDQADQRPAPPVSCQRPHGLCKGHSHTSISSKDQRYEALYHCRVGLPTLL
jgi:hypothetical protein